MDEWPHLRAAQALSMDEAVAVTRRQPQRNGPPRAAEQASLSEKDNRHFFGPRDGEVGIKRMYTVLAGRGVRRGGQVEHPWPHRSA
jgi:hypothetical protein